jgi:two-component system, cell cycle response regulator DivK
MPAKGSPPPAPLVLVIDDAEDNREVYVQFFEFQGWRTATASDGEDGLDKASALAPTVIVLDLSLPLMDGWEVARRLKANGKTRSIPVIALTGHALDDSRRKAIAAGVDEYLTKPCLPADLAAVIKRHLR